ncbi:beta-galactosidase [Cutibacterium acnes]
MITIVGEYPYYRARITDWAVDLARLHSEGIEAISFYIPWRLHERSSGDIDFTGADVSNANLDQFFDLLRNQGLKAVVKPGPFIHAEVRYGGLPDRIVHCSDSEKDYRFSSFGIGFGEDPPLSSVDSSFLTEAITWLEIVRDRLVVPNLDIVAAVQIGNEGVFSDAAKPTDHPRCSPVSGIDQVLSTFSNVFADVPVKRYINLPLPDPSIANHLAYDWWVTRVLPLTEVAGSKGYTAWAGPTSTSDEALARTLMASPHFDMGCVEENWGHVWDGSHYRSADVLLHHSVLSLALGSSTLSIYTACTTNSMDSTLQPTTTDLLAEGMEPKAFTGVYCLAAPLAAGGKDGETLDGLRRLVALRDAISEKGTRWSICYDLDLIIDPGAAFITWRVAGIVKDLLVRYGLHARTIFSSAAEVGSSRPAVRVQTAGDPWESDELCVTVRRGGRDVEWIPMDATQLDAESIWRILQLTPKLPSLDSNSSYRIRWVAGDDSDACLDFIFNRASEKVDVRYGIESSSGGSVVNHCLRLGPTAC